MASETTKEEVWNEWTSRYVSTEEPTPLFETNEDLTVQYKNYGKDNRRILKRSPLMEERVRTEGRKVIKDWEESDDNYDGLIYMMYWLKNDEVIPLYIGKAGKYGRDSSGLSANLRGLRGTNTGKFARWGDSHYYHIGNLSAIVFDHDKNQKQKYKRWAKQLFEDGRKLQHQTYFWVIAWGQDDTGPYHDFEVPLGQLEYQIIGLTSDLYSDKLLNKEGS